MTLGAYTRLEIDSQPSVWQATLDDIAAQQGQLSSALAGLSTAPLIVTGCGSTYYLSLHAAAVLRKIGVQAWALPASELVYFAQEHRPRRFNLLAVSRSGTTTETVRAVEGYRAAHPQGTAIAITCAPETPLTAHADASLVAAHAPEQSVAQTRSFTSMALLAQALAGLVAGNPARLTRLRGLPAALAGLIEREPETPQQIGADLSIERLFFLGSGPLYGIACEAMLKTKEMTCSWAEAYHVLEFRHGPMSLAGQGALVVGLISDSAAEAEIKVLHDMRQLGARTLALAEARGSYDWIGVDQVIELHSGLDEWERGALYLPLLQWIAFHRALAKGLDPDHPVNLTAVVYL